MTADREWHLDKKVPVVFILALLANVAGFGVLYGTMRADVTTNAANIMAMKAVQDRMRDDAAEAAATLAAIQTDINGMRRDLTRLIEIIDRMQRAP